MIDLLKNSEKNDLGDMISRMELTYSEILNKLDTKYIVASTIWYTPKPGFYEINDITFLLKSLLPDEVKVNITNDDKIQRSN